MCEAFQVEDLALMIRATRGRSSRPNHMATDENPYIKALSGIKFVFEFFYCFEFS